MYKVLIVDDEVIEREYLKSIFIKHSDKYSIVGDVCDGIEAISLSGISKPDIVIMDINMPLCNGLTAAKNIKQILYNPIIILNTAYSEFEYAKQAIDYDLDSYLLKPASEEDILKTIEDCIIKKSVISDLPLETFISLNINYPFNIVDKINDSILNQNITDLNLNTFNYLNFIQSQHNDLPKYKLNIVNSVISILVQLRKVLPEFLFTLFDSEQYPYKIMTSKQINTTISIIEDFFNKMLCVFINNKSNKMNISDMIETYIEENYKNEINLETLSTKFHYSPTYLSRIFHQEKGFTLNHYIHKVRIDKASSLLTNSDLSIKEIALSCGFVNISHFNRTFKSMTRKTPMDLRKGKNINFD